MQRIKIIVSSTAFLVDLNISQHSKGTNVIFWRRLNTFAEFIIHRSVRNIY